MQDKENYLELHTWAGRGNCPNSKDIISCGCKPIIIHPRQNTSRAFHRAPIGQQLLTKSKSKDRDRRAPWLQPSNLQLCTTPQDLQGEGAPPPHTVEEGMQLLPRRASWPVVRRAGQASIAAPGGAGTPWRSWPCRRRSWECWVRAAAFLARWTTGFV